MEFVQISAIAFSSKLHNAITSCLSPLRNSDRSYGLENGRIVQEETFTQLAQQQGPSAQLRS